MSPSAKKYTIIATVLVSLIAAAIGFFYQSSVKSEVKNIKADVLPQHKAKVQVPPKPKLPVKVSTETKNISVVFTYGGDILSSSSIDLYKIIKENDVPVKIQADGVKMCSLVDNLDLPIPASIDHSQIVQQKFGLQKIIKGTSYPTVNKEKTLRELQTKVTENRNLEADLLVVPIHTITDESGGVTQLMEKMGFTTVIASFTSMHDEAHRADENRNINLKIASDKINNIILQPNDKFSFNKVVGNRTKANGFKDAGVIQSGRVIPGIGGGICQVSTTLYRAVLNSGMKIIERHNHSIYDGIAYAERGLDAAVAWGYKDFIFTNPLPIPILLTSQSGDGWVSVQIHASVNPFDKIEVKTANEVKHPAVTERKINKKLKQGEVKVLHPGVDGYSIEAYRTITENGNSRVERLSKDRYLTFNRKEEVNP